MKALGGKMKASGGKTEALGGKTKATGGKTKATGGKTFGLLQKTRLKQQKAQKEKLDGYLLSKNYELSEMKRGGMRQVGRMT